MLCSLVWKYSWTKGKEINYKLQPSIWKVAAMIWGWISIRYGKLPLYIKSEKKMIDHYTS